MNLARSQVVLRMRGIGEILDLACLITFSHALALYAKLAIFALLPAYAACLALRHALELDWVWVWLLAVPMASFCQGPFTVAAGRWLFAEAVGVKDVLKAFGARFASFFGAWLIRWLALAFSTLMGVLPGALPGTLLLFVPEATLLELASPFEAQGRSSACSRFDRGRALLMWAALSVTVLIFVGLAELLCDGLVDDVLQLGRPFESLWPDGGSPYALLGLFLSVPYVATARFLMYIDGRTRGDGWDIQVRFMAISRQAEATRLDAGRLAAGRLEGAQASGAGR
jgi:hypothetical protein